MAKHCECVEEHITELDYKHIFLVLGEWKPRSRHSEKWQNEILRKLRKKIHNMRKES